MAVPVVLEKHVAAADGGHEQILAAIVIDVAECRADADPPWQAHTRFLGDVLELAAAKVLPQLVASYLAHEINVVEPVTVHVRHCQAVAVIILAGLHVNSCVRHAVLNERNAALLHAIGELKVVKYLELVGSLELGFLRAVSVSTPISGSG
jgi:hypothetical protein